MKEHLIGQEHGPLHGVRVMLTGVAFAGPFAARWLGDMGAEIIKIEIPGAGDTSRIGRRVGEANVVPKWISLGRNMNSFEFNMNFDTCPDSKQVFEDLVKQCDIWINSVPNIGKHGATDELAFAANPKLVIVHVTGYGLPENGGDERLLGRPSVDPVAQAFSGLAAMQGMPDGPFLTANPILCDIVTAHQAACGALAAYINVQHTGKGQVVDASLYESAAYLMSYHWCSQLNGEGLYHRSGPLNQLWRPFGYYECKDGEWVAVGVWGLGIWQKFCDLMGVSVDDFPYMATCGQEDPEKVAQMDARSGRSTSTIIRRSKSRLRSWRRACPRPSSITPRTRIAIPIGRRAATSSPSRTSRPASRSSTSPRRPSSTARPARCTRALRCWGRRAISS